MVKNHPHVCGAAVAAAAKSQQQQHHTHEGGFSP